MRHAMTESGGEWASKTVLLACERWQKRDQARIQAAREKEIAYTETLRRFPFFGSRYTPEEAEREVLRRETGGISEMPDYYLEGLMVRSQVESLRHMASRMPETDKMFLTLSDYRLIGGDMR